MCDRGQIEQKILGIHTFRTWLKRVENEEGFSQRCNISNNKDVEYQYWWKKIGRAR